MHQSDRELAKSIQRGSEDAFNELVRLYGGLIKSIVYYHFRNFPMWQEDCINDVLFKIWQNIKRYDPDKNTLKNWIGAVAKYRAIDFKRRYYRELMTGELKEDIADERMSAELLRQETEEEVASLLSGLDERDREIFIRRYIMDSPIDEIASSQGRSAGYIYNRLSRGRRKLRRLFVKERS